jgi:hypothetical protein
MRHRNLWPALLLTVVVIAGCAPTDVRSTRGASADQPLPRPDRIVVYDFVIAPGDVRLNSGPGARVRRMLGSEPASAEQTKVGAQVAKVFSEELVKAIAELGIPVERSAHLSRVPDRTLAIDGQFVSIDEGNRARRMVIGFGLGATEVSAHVQVYLGMPTQQVLVQEFETKAESSKKPGAAVTMGAGAAVGAGMAVGGAASGALELQAGVEADARRTARKLAEQLKELFTRRGWIAATSS